jgi:redox-sensitive bicupin YhaK (pirin superfamily)
MITIRPSDERGGGDYGWLKTRHTFSFSDYSDPKWMGFRSLRVINEDWVAPGGGFPTHPHRDMEIITYVLSGKLEHKDSLGTGSVILPGDGQRMTAGRGIRHSEANASRTEAVHLLQIWILPDKSGYEPGYEQKSFPESEKRGKFRLIASNDGAEGSVKINQDAKLFVTLLASGEEVTQPLGGKRSAWLQVAKGELELNGKRLKQGDGAAITDEAKLKVKAIEEAEVLLFDLA